MSRDTKLVLIFFLLNPLLVVRMYWIDWMVTLKHVTKKPNRLKKYKVKAEKIDARGCRRMLWLEKYV